MFYFNIINPVRVSRKPRLLVASQASEVSTTGIIVYFGLVHGLPKVLIEMKGYGKLR